MKGIKVLLGLSITAVGVGAVSLGVASTNKASLNTVTAAAPTNQRRIWVVDNNGDSSDTNWWTGKTFYAYAWNANGTVEVKFDEMVLDDYGCGLHYVDITLAAATTSLNVIIRVGDDTAPYSWGNNNQSGEAYLGALGTADVVYLNNGVFWESNPGRNSRNISLGKAGASAAQLAVIASKYDTCSAAVTNGYHAFEQFETDFYNPTDDPARDTTMVYGQSTYTIKDCYDGMKARHEANL